MEHFVAFPWRHSAILYGLNLPVSQQQYKEEIVVVTMLYECPTVLHDTYEHLLGTI